MPWLRAYVSSGFHLFFRLSVLWVLLGPQKADLRAFRVTGSLNTSAFMSLQGEVSPCWLLSEDMGRMLAEDSFYLWHDFAQVAKNSL